MAMKLRRMRWSADRPRLAHREYSVFAEIWFWSIFYYWKSYTFSFTNKNQIFIYQIGLILLYETSSLLFQKYDGDDEDPTAALLPKEGNEPLSSTSNCTALKLKNSLTLLHSCWAERCGGGVVMMVMLVLFFTHFDSLSVVCAFYEH